MLSWDPVCNACTRHSVQPCVTFIAYRRKRMVGHRTDRVEMGQQWPVKTADSPLDSEYMAVWEKTKLHAGFNKLLSFLSVMTAINLEEIVIIRTSTQEIYLLLNLCLT
jgi:hypothetical protein